MSGAIEPGAIAAAVLAGATAPVTAVPGGGASLDVLDALTRSGVDVVVPHHEATAGTIAATLGALRGRPGVAVTIKGPGLANLVPALAHAHLEAWPMVALVEAHGPGATGHHKRLDHARLAGALTRARGAAGAAGGAVAAALTIAATEPAGPVLVELTEGEPPTTPPSHGASAPEAGRTAALRAVDAARRPVVLAGALAGRVGLGATLSGLRVPVATTVAGKGVVDERRAPSAGIVTGVGGPRSTEVALLDEADLVIAIGVRLHELLAPLESVTVVTVGGDGAPIAHEHVAHLPLDALDDVLGALDRVDRDGSGIDPMRCHARVAALSDELVGADAWLPAAVLAAAQEVLTGGGPGPTMVLDTGDFCTVAEHVLAARAPGDVIGAACSRAMGTGIATALGAALARADRTTLLAVGDGGIGGAFGELTLAVERRLPLVVVVLEDGGFASIRGRAVARGRSTSTLVHPARAWARAAEGLGIPAHVATSVADVRAALDARDDGPLLVSCAFDPDRYVTMAEGLR